MVLHHLLLTGKPRIGKTTLIQSIIEKLSNDFPKFQLTGFITKEVRSHGERVGFDLCTLDGQTGILARTFFPDKKERQRVGKYFVDLEDLEKLAIPSLFKDADLIILDEIGKMELLSSYFKETIEILFKGNSLILGTISFYDTPETIKLKKLNQTKIIEVTHQNRDHLLETVIHEINLVKQS